MKSIGETVILDVDSKQPYKIKKLRDKIRNIIDRIEITNTGSSYDNHRVEILS